MELLLNLLWLLVALASAVKFAVWSRGAGRRRRFGVAVATVCILSLLFPIISITDDLHLKKAVVEEAKSLSLGPAVAITLFVLTVVAVVRAVIVAIPAAPVVAAVAERGPPV